MRPLVAALIALVLVLAAGEAEARKRRARKKAKPAAAEIVVGDGEGADGVSAKESATKKEKMFDFTDFSIEGKLRTPQLLYFLGRARSELERAALEERTFIPEMVRSIDAEGL